MSERKTIRVVAAEIERDGRFLITQRRPSAILPLLWEFPSGRVEDGDSFTLSQNSAGQNDGRNIDELISLQSGDPRDPKKLSFQDIFGVMIAGVGSSVNSSKIAADIQEENMMAAKEAEAEFAGVNLDTEAAALIEFQQAYQASARILSTARELFQSLMEVV